LNEPYKCSICIELDANFAVEAIAPLASRLAFADGATRPAAFVGVVRARSWTLDALDRPTSQLRSLT